MRVRALAGSALIVAILIVGGVEGASAAGDAAKGQLLFKNTCALCHLAKADATTADAAMRIGPNLFGVVGRPAGTLKGFHYSQAMRNSGLTWTNDNLQRYVHAPQVTVPNVRMSFRGLANQNDVDNVIAFLNTLKK